MRTYGFGNVLAAMSMRNPQITRRIFSQLMNNRVDKNSANVKKTLSEYDEKLSNAVNDADKKLAARGIKSPLYTSKSSIQADYYSSLGGLFNYLL